MRLGLSAGGPGPSRLAACDTVLHAALVYLFLVRDSLTFCRERARPCLEPVGSEPGQALNQWGALRCFLF